MKVVFSSRNPGYVQLLKVSKFSGHFKYARAFMRIGRYAHAQVRMQQDKLINFFCISVIFPKTYSFTCNCVLLLS